MPLYPGIPYEPVDSILVNVLDHGVIGVGDETAAIQAVATAFVGHKLLLPSGKTFQISQLLLPTGSRLRIEGTLQRFAGTTLDLVCNQHFNVFSALCADGAMAQGSAVLTSASNPFSSGQVGQPINVPTAAPGGATLTTTVASYQGPGQVTLSCSSRSDQATSGAAVTIGTRDSDIKIEVGPGGVVDGGGGSADVRLIRFDTVTKPVVDCKGTLKNTPKAAVIFRQGCIDYTMADGYTLDGVGTGTIGQGITVFRGCQNGYIGTGTMRNPNGASVIGVLVDDGEQGSDTSWPCDTVHIRRPRIYGFQEGVDIEGALNVTIDAMVDGATGFGIIVQGGIDGAPSQNVDILASALVKNLAANADGVSICGIDVRDLGCTVDGVAAGTGRGKVLRGEGALPASVPSQNIYFGPGKVKNNLGAEGLRLAPILCNGLTIDHGTYSGGPGADGIAASGGNGGARWLIDSPRIEGAGHNGVALAPGGAVAAGLIVRDVVTENVGTAAANTYDGVSIAGSGAFTRYAVISGVRANDDQAIHTTRNAVTVPSSATFAVFDCYGIGILGSDVSGAPSHSMTFSAPPRSTSGMLVTPVTTKTGAYTILVTDAILLGSGTFTFTLPAPATSGNGKRYDIYNTGVGVITIAPVSGTINGAASITVAAGVRVSVACDGSNYFAA